jgi:hypothetical protein
MGAHRRRAVAGRAEVGHLAAKFRPSTDKPFGVVRLNQLDRGVRVDLTAQPALQHAPREKADAGLLHEHSYRHTTRLDVHNQEMQKACQPSPTVGQQPQRLRALPAFRASYALAYLFEREEWPEPLLELVDVEHLGAPALRAARIEPMTASEVSQKFRLWVPAHHGRTLARYWLHIQLSVARTGT